MITITPQAAGQIRDSARQAGLADKTEYWLKGCVQHLMLEWSLAFDSETLRLRWHSTILAIQQISQKHLSHRWESIRTGSHVSIAMAL